MKTQSDRLQFARKQRNVTLEQIGDWLNITGDGVRKALIRNSLRPTYMNIISNKLKISRKWLETGQGEWDDYDEGELVSISDYDAHVEKAPAPRLNKTTPLVPFYNIDFAASNDIAMLDAQLIKPDYYMDVPEFAGCTAFRAYSTSMEKKIKSGSILFGTKVEQWQTHLEYGQIYGIICTDGRRYLKYIRRHQEWKQYLLLRSENDEYDDFDMPREAIRSIWLIHGWLNKRV